MVSGLYATRFPKPERCTPCVCYAREISVQIDQVRCPRFTFTDEKAQDLLESLQGQEYGFWHVNPAGVHPRLSQRVNAAWR